MEISFMRKITEKIVTAFLDGNSLAIDNTMTDGADIRLHGNVIAYWDIDATVIITLAGWNTVTTRERLNGLLTMMKHHKRIIQKKGEPYFIDLRNLNTPAQLIDDAEHYPVSQNFFSSETYAEIMERTAVA